MATPRAASRAWRRPARRSRRRTRGIPQQHELIELSVLGQSRFPPGFRVHQRRGRSEGRCLQPGQKAVEASRNLKASVEPPGTIGACVSCQPSCHTRAEADSASVSSACLTSMMFPLARLSRTVARTEPGTRCRGAVTCVNHGHGRRQHTPPPVLGDSAPRGLVGAIGTARGWNRNRSRPCRRWPRSHALRYVGSPRWRWGATRPLRRAR